MRLRRPRITPRRVEVVAALVLVACVATQASAATRYFAGKKKTKVATWAVTTNHVTLPVFAVQAAAPGDSGTGTLVVQNVGAKSARMFMTYVPVSRSRLDAALQLSIYDSTTRQCLWPPVGKPKKVRKGKKWVLVFAKVNPCLHQAPWTASVRNQAVYQKGWTPLMKNGRITPPTKYLWKRKERHVLLVRWTLPATADNTYQGQTSSFRLAWKATK